MSFILICIRLFIVLIDTLNEWIGRALAWLTLLTVLLTFVVVLLRYCFDLGWVAMQESITYLHVLVFMLGAAYTLKHDRHVRVDIVYQRCSVKTKAWIDFLGSLLLLLPVCGFIVWSSWDYVSNAWEIEERSRNTGGLPGLYLLKSTMPIFAVLLALQGMSIVLRSLMTALGFALTPEHRHG